MLFWISFCAGAESPESPAVATEAPVSHTNTSLDWLFDTPPSPPVRPAPAPPLVTLTFCSQFPSCSENYSSLLSVPDFLKDSVSHTTQVQPKAIPPRPKTPKMQILDLECDNLADQVKQMRKSLISRCRLSQLPVMMIRPPGEASHDQSFGADVIHPIHTTGVQLFGLETVF